MKTLKDRDLGIDCDFEATGKSVPEVVDVMTTHIRSEHPEEYDRVKSMMKMNIQDTEGETDEESEDDQEGIPEVGNEEEKPDENL